MNKVRQAAITREIIEVVREALSRFSERQTYERQQREQKVGKVIQVIGPVIDVEFEEGHLPAIYNALRIVGDGAAAGEKIDIITEVEQHLGEGRVRTVAMKPTDGLQRGMDAIDTGAPISVPVGPARSAAC